MQNDAKKCSWLCNNKKSNKKLKEYNNKVLKKYFRRFKEATATNNAMKVPTWARRSTRNESNCKITQKRDDEVRTSAPLTTKTEVATPALATTECNFNRNKRNATQGSATVYGAANRRRWRQKVIASHTTTRIAETHHSAELQGDFAAAARNGSCLPHTFSYASVRCMWQVEKFSFSMANTTQRAKHVYASKWARCGVGCEAMRQRATATKDDTLQPQAINARVRWSMRSVFAFAVVVTHIYA